MTFIEDLLVHRDKEWREAFLKACGMEPADIYSVGSVIGCIRDGAKRDRDKDWESRLEWIGSPVGEPPPSRDYVLTSDLIALIRPIVANAKAEQNAADLKIAQDAFDNDVFVPKLSGPDYVKGYEDAAIDIAKRIRESNTDPSTKTGGVAALPYK